MDRELISFKFAMLRNSSKGLRRLGWVLGGALVVATWAAGAFAADPGVRHSVLSLIFALWLIGAMIGPVMMSGAGVLRADYFALLPIPRATLGRGLLVSVFVGVGAAYVLLALSASIWHAAPLGIAAIVVTVVGAILGWVFAITMSRLVYGLLGAAMRTRLGIEIAGVQWGIFFAVFFTGWIAVSAAVQTIPGLLRSGLPAGPITAALDAFPTTWPMLAAEAISEGDPGRAALLLLALLAIDVLAIALTIPLLVPAQQRAARRRERPRSVQLVAGGGVLPATPTGAVIMKELRQWRRDSWRSLESSTALWTGVAIGVFALLGGFSTPVAGFAGVAVAIMVSLAGCNLYGQDGSAVWQNVVGETNDSVRADVRGRQWAMAIIFLPRALVVSAIFLLFAQAWWSIPLIIAAVVATVGAASGAAIITSAVGVSPGVDPRRRVGPNDANGNISLHIWVALLVTVLGVLPTAGIIGWGIAAPTPWLLIATPLLGIINGLGAAWLFGKIAIRYLNTRMPEVFSRIRYARVFRASSGGLLEAVADATLKGELQASDNRQKERDEKLAKRKSSSIGHR